MREVHLGWDEDTVANSEYGRIGQVAHKLEVVGHLAINENGIRQLVRPDFKEGFGPDDLDKIPFLEVEDVMKNSSGDHLIIWNSHPLSLAAIRYADIHILPPYCFGSDGIQITVRGTPSGISQFLKTCRAMLPPDHVKVVEMVDEKSQVYKTLTEKQIEFVRAAQSAGYYEVPKKTTIRELSEILGTPRSTIQEHLNRAEAAMMNWAAECLKEND